MSKMDEVLNENEASLIENQARHSKASSKATATMTKAMEKRIRVSEKLLEAIRKYSACDSYPAEVESDMFKAIYAALQNEQFKLNSALSELL